MAVILCSLPVYLCVDLPSAQPGFQGHDNLQMLISLLVGGLSDSLVCGLNDWILFPVKNQTDSWRFISQGSLPAFKKLFHPCW